MNINELESFKLSDAVKFHDTLNPMLFTDEHLNSDVREKLLEIADEFIDYLGINNLDIDDITLSGSNAAYSYTDHSDVDLHILVDMSKINNDDVYRELFSAKKNLFNDNHDIKIRGYDVELYVQDKNQPVKSLGEYSVLNDRWIKIPTRQRASIDQNSVKNKVTKMVQMAEISKRSNNIDQLDNVLSTIRRYRQAGLDKHGEFGPENIAFKILRTNGIIDDLYKYRNKLYSYQLSLDEDYDVNDVPPGPEFKPTMPKGTVRVDVSDVYDWYKIGQNISDLGRADKNIFGKGPPSTIFSFGSEDQEHEYIKDLESLGLTTTDIDPVDPNQPKNIPRQKTDPTFNVAEAFDKPYKSKWKKSEHGDYDTLIKLPDGTNLSIMFNNQGDDEYQVEFYRNNSQEVTGEGDAQRVFATVLNSIQKFIKKHKPWRLTFSASKESDADSANSESRAKLYDRLVSRYAKAWGYEAYSEDHGDQITYELTILNQDVAESKITEASGYIPSESEKNDPRFCKALSVDVHPDTMKKNAAKFGWKIARNGRPPLLRK